MLVNIEWQLESSNREFAMPTFLRKLYNNFAPIPSLKALGPALYLKYLAAGVVSIPGIIRNGNLRSVDRVIGCHAKTFYRDRRPFIYDCEWTDETLGASQADNYAFGIAREIYIRDCYFKFLPIEIFQTAKTVVDIGSNRGAFSCMMTTVAKKILAVEAFPDLAAVTRHNLDQNQFTEYAIEVVFLGEGGEQFDSSLPKMSIDDLFDRHKLYQIDLMKMDIEGSEFSLFVKPEWLRRVGALTMEVHPSCGDPSMIVRCLEESGFNTRFADENLAILPHSGSANFIYSWRKS